MDLSSRSRLGLLFPSLIDDGFEPNSPKDISYNCIAFAAGDSSRKWWPDEFDLDYWPPDAPREETLEAFEAVFNLLGYEKCASSSMEVDFEKIAIFVSGSTPTHASRMLKDGRWVSKIGELEDIKHSKGSVCGSVYGNIASVMKRPWNPEALTRKKRFRRTSCGLIVAVLLGALILLLLSFLLN